MTHYPASQAIAIRSLPPAVVIAIGIASDAACSIAKAQLAATFIVSRLGPELGAIERLVQAATASLARNGGQGILSAGWTGRSILCSVGHATAGTAIGITHQDPAK